MLSEYFNQLNELLNLFWEYYSSLVLCLFIDHQSEQDPRISTFYNEKYIHTGTDGQQIK